MSDERITSEEARRRVLAGDDHGDALMVYDVTTDTFRPAKQDDINRMQRAIGTIAQAVRGAGAGNHRGEGPGQLAGRLQGLRRGAAYAGERLAMDAEWLDREAPDI